MSTPFATIVTSRGTIVAELFERDCPETVENFTRLANEGFYDGLPFHRVEPGIVAQTGDPRARELPFGHPRIGMGGPEYTTPPETVGNRQRHQVGTLSMVHEGGEGGGSRFNIMLGDQRCREFDGVHTVFGQATEGVEILASISPTDVVRRLRVDQ